MRNEKMCRRKKVYWTETSAWFVAQRVRERRGIQLRVYKCPYCYEYHLTKQA